MDSEVNVKYRLTETSGAAKFDRTWMTTFWEAFSDCVFEIDAYFNVTNVLKKTDSTFTMNDIAGKSFMEIAVEADRAPVENELRLLRDTDVPYRRFTFLSVLGRYYRMTLIARRNNGLFMGLRGIAVDVTGQSLKEITLNWQHAIIEGSSDFITITDLDGNALYTNPGAYKMSGYDPETGVLPLERILTPGHMLAIREEGLRETIDNGSWNYRGEMICADGTRKPVVHNMFIVRDEQDEAILLANIIRDVTGFVEHERTLRQEQSQTALLATVAMKFSLSDDFDTNMKHALAYIGSHVGADTMYIYRDYAELRSFICEYHWSNDGVYGPPAGRGVSYFDPVTGAYSAEYDLLQHESIFVANDMSVLEPNLFAKARSAGVKSMVCLPVHVDNEFWGFIGLSMYTSGRVWSERDIGFLKTICGILSTSLEKQLMSQRWQAAQADLQAVVHNYPGVIWSLNSKRRFTLYDGAFPGKSENKIPDINGQLMYDYARKNPGVIHSSILEKSEQTFSGEPQDWMMELENAVFRCNTVPLRDAQGDITGVVGAAVDVTGMIQMQKDLEVARTAAEAANIAKSEFLSRMSHEIRTPMNAIIGMTQIARNTNDEERIRNSLFKIDNASKHLLALINDILDISKIEANKLELQSELFDLGEFIDNIHSIINVKAEEKDQTFILSYSELLPKYLVGDQLRFSQVIINLLGNAIKFTPINGLISLEIKKLECSKDECAMEIRISDSGIGISAENQKKLFAPFEQADGSITREYGGTGLGLAICKYIVELMGGKIWVESSPGNGSVFIFTARMRIGDDTNGMMRTRHHDIDITEIDDLGKYTILLAEDIEINREIVYAILEDTNIAIESAENGARAVEMFTCAPDKYNIVFMDLQMPIMDGLEAARRIRALNTEKAQKIPIVAMTANVFKEDVDKCLSAGMNDHIAKPIDRNQLLEKLVYFLSAG